MEFLGLVFERHDEFVARAPLRERQFETGIAQPGHQVVGVQRRVLGDAFHAVTSQHPHVDVRAQQHARITHEPGQAANALWNIVFGSPVVDRVPVDLALGDHGNRHERQQAFVYPDRTGARSTTAMGRRKRLVEVHVDDVEIHIAGPHLAKNGVQVRSVVIQQAACIVDHVGDDLDMALKHAQRRRIGQHDARRLRPKDGLECLHVDIAVRERRDFLHYAAAHRRGRRIRAVCRIRTDDLGSLCIAASIMKRFYHCHAGEFALCTRHRRQRYALHAGHVLEHLLQFVHARQEALAVADRPKRMPAGELGQQCQLVAGARIVFHRARTQRVELGIDREVLLRQPRVMSDRLQFRGFRQARSVLTQKFLGDRQRPALDRRLRECPAAAT